jgi:AraC-like DNA-binding protein
LEKRDTQDDIRPPAPPRDVGTARGVLRHADGPGRFEHARVAPPAPLDAFVEHFWSVRWDLHGHAPQLRETLPHPNVHLVVERGLTALFGVHTARYVRHLEGLGCAFGVKFRPGGFHPFLRRPLTSIADGSLPLHAVFGADADGFEDAVLACADTPGMIEAATRFLLAQRPQPDAQAERAAGIVALIAGDRGLTRVEDLVRRCGLGTRALQRLFGEYVGVGPKWVIQRYRLHEAVEQLAGRRPPDWSALAQDLGYFDQAHFIRDFKRLVGRTPADYAAS